MFTYQNQEKSSRFLLSDHLTKARGAVSITCSNYTLIPYLTSQSYKLSNRTIVLVTNTSDDAQRYVQELRFFMGNKLSKQVVYFPAYNVSSLERISYHNEISSKRIACLYNLLESNSNIVIVTDLSGIRQKLIPKKVLIKYLSLVEVGEEINTEGLVEKLTYGGYKRAALVEEPGDFSVRGGIIDFFPPIYKKPIRMEFFGDLIESIRFFSPVNQRTFDEIGQVIILPACEAVFEKDRLNSIIGNVRSMAIRQNLNGNDVREIIDNIKNHNTFSDMSKMIPMIYKHMDSLFDYLPDSAIFVTIDQSKLALNASVLEKEANDNYNKVLSLGKLCTPPENLFLSYQTIRKKMLSKNSFNYNSLVIVGSGQSLTEKYLEINAASNDAIVLSMEKARRSDNPFLPLLKVLSENKSNGYKTVLACNSENQVTRLTSILSSSGVETLVGVGFPDNATGFSVHVSLGSIRHGFILHDTSIMVITYEEIFGIKPRHRKLLRSKAKVKSFDLENLKKGEFVVHAEHGIGHYDGLINLNINGVLSDFLLITYRNKDKLYLPVDRMEFIHRYMGVVEGDVPILDKMGGRAWNLLKDKVRHSAEKIAGSLLKVYSKRKVQIGHSFNWDDQALSDFESQFTHEETSDQSKAISDVLTDMAQPVPMDRLVCGDVGYGKTEVALRASFVAVTGGKQVAILVPTTVLAEQHFVTFSNRFKHYPVKVACLSRFKSRSEQKDIISDIKSGIIDIVVGTHRILQPDMVFMDLGLVILDEEQRFGVKDKEKLKEIRTLVDVLALTATPIPRTLHLSLMGVRDISIISTPPDQRRSIITYVCEFDDATVVKAIRNELNRKGQIFFIHNNINTIKMLALRLKTHVPEVRLDVAHGQMSEENLERVMMAFVEGKIDMLVCTTIIESGIDIAKANTIMVNRADKFGLAQMYQIRGRVGRSDEQAYAYLFIPEGGTLGSKASKRLKVLMEHSDLGSGFQIAMNDMKIRGGGTILGASQSGHIAAVGYDMFLKLMEESIAKIKGEPLDAFFDTEINIPISAFISEDYIPDIDQRLSMYRRMSKIKHLADVSNLKEEIIDRFGLMPEETENLFLKIMFKVLGSRAGVQKIDLSNHRLTLSFTRAYQQQSPAIRTMVEKGNGSCRLTLDGTFVTNFKSTNISKQLVQMRNILIEITRHVSS